MTNFTLEPNFVETLLGTVANSAPQPNMPATSLPSSNIVPAPNGSTMKGGALQSPNFNKGTSGWNIDSSGNAEFNDGTFRGTFNLGGTVITISSVQDLQATLDEVEAEGGGTVFLNPGTYVLDSDITIPSGVTLEGVSRDEVIIECGSYSVKMIGSNGYTTGTVAVNKGSTTVTGTGTTWIAGMVGRSILLDGNWYEITARASDTSITIGSVFAGSISGGNISGANYAIADVNFASNIRRLVIQNSSGSGLVLQYAMEPKIDDVLVYDCNVGIDCDYVVYPQLFTTASGSGTNLDFNYVYGFEIIFSAFDSASGAGVVMTNSGNATFFDSVVTGNTGNGMTLTSCNNIAFISMTVNSNGSHGIEFVSGNNDLEFIAVTSQANTGDGYKLTATSDRITIVNSALINNGAYGINIADATCDDNIVVGTSFSGNSSGTVSDSGTNTTIRSNSKVPDKQKTVSLTSSATPTPNADITDLYTVTALAEAATFGAPTGAPNQGQKLIIRIKDNGTARALSWNAIYRASSDLALPTTTVLSKTMYLGFIYNSTDSKWDLLAVLDNF